VDQGGLIRRDGHAPPPGWARGRPIRNAGLVPALLFGWTDPDFTAAFTHVTDKLWPRRLVRPSQPGALVPRRAPHFEEIPHMDSPLIPQRAPYGVPVEAGATYWWCACGRSASQPFCDGSHKGSGLMPVKHVAERSETLWFCGCKRSATAPFCDGSHRRLAKSTP
jgi:CDGSH iron-sulfur domain-containing protein 3